MFGFLRRRRAERRAKELPVHRAESRRRDEEEKRRFDKSIALYNRALKAEKAGRYNQALKLYLENIDLYSPRGLSHWKRPAILLEKLKRYDEAIEICNQALELDVDVSSTRKAFAEEFSKRKARLERKLQRPAN